MTDKQKLDEIISLMTFLQRHIENYVNQSFTELTFNLETVIKDFLNVFEKKSETYENINFLNPNYPAIDLVNKKKNIAIQITTNADMRKVRKTLETYQRHNINYSNLIIIGFIKTTKSTLPNITVHGIDYLIELVKHGSSKEKDLVYDILKSQIPLNILNPLNDKQCLEVVLNVIDRSAVRDYTICEGSYEKMVQGLYEIKEIITTGIIKGKSIRAKALVEYTNDVRDKLADIEYNISKIIQICNCNRNKSSFICLDRSEMDAIDKIKENIIKKSNELARTFQINKEIIGSKRW